MRHYLLCLAVLAFASPAWAELRLFGINNWFFADSMNDYLRSDNLKPINDAPGWGVDWTFPLSSRFYLGARGMFRKMHLGDGSGATSLAGDPYYAELSMESGGPVLRWFLIDSDTFRFDVFGGGTYIHGSLETLEATGTYQWATTQNDMRFGSIAGGSISFGGRRVFVVIEGGYEWFWLSDLRRSPTASSSVNNFDLRGCFATIGIGLRPFLKSQGGDRAPASENSSASSGSNGNSGGNESFLDYLGKLFAPKK